jgi:subtilase family serine protease
VDWSGEIALDVEWSHAIAPAATIDLVIAKSDQDPDILAAQQYVINNNLGDVLSQSFGEPETCMAPSTMTATEASFAKAAREGMTVFASSGDDGSAQTDCDNDGNYFEGVSYPAASPWVTSVGGTSLVASQATGNYESETVWNDDFGASGGGYSTLFSKPLFQTFAQRSHYRGVPDVAYNGDVNNGVLVAWSQGVAANVGSIYLFGGTSAGSPQWAAITALADQAAKHRLGFIDPSLYAIGAIPATDRYAFHDVTSGNNILDGTGVTAGYSAAPGWDATTGLGTPDAAHLISLLQHT